MKKNKRGQEWGKGWDGKSRVPDKTYKENYDSIDWSYTKKKKKRNETVNFTSNYVTFSRLFRT
jgi:hypothetical protein